MLYSGSRAVSGFLDSDCLACYVLRQARAILYVARGQPVHNRGEHTWFTTAAILFPCGRPRSLQYLVRRGVPEDDATRLLAYRDKAMRAAASAAPAAPARPPEPPALGVPVIAPSHAAPGASSASAAATITLTRTVVTTTKQEAEGFSGSAAPAVESRSTKDTLTVRAWVACGFC